MIRNINRKVDVRRFEKVRLVHDLLGVTIAQSDEIKFDLGEATRNLKYYSMDSIPYFERKIFLLKFLMFDSMFNCWYKN